MAIMQEIPPPKGSVPIDVPPPPVGSIEILTEPKQEELQFIKSAKPILERGTTEILSGGMDHISETIPEYMNEYRKRQSKHYGFASDLSKSKYSDYQEDYDHLQEYLDYTMGGADDMQNIVNKVFDGNAKLASHEGYDEPVIQFNDGTIIEFDKAGINKQDWIGLDISGGLKELGAGIAGGVVGLVGGGVGSALGATAASSAAAWHNKKVNLEEGKKRGFHSLSEEKISEEAWFDAKISAGIDLATFGLGRIFRTSMKDSITKTLIKTGVIKKEDVELVSSIAARESKQGRDINLYESFAIASNEAKGAEKERLKAASSEIYESFQTVMKRDESKEAFEEVVKGKAEIREAQEGVFKDVPEKILDKEATGVALQRRAETSLAIQEERLSKQAYDDIDDLAQQQIDILEGPDVPSSAIELRETLRQTRNEVFNRLSKEYDDLWSEVPDGLYIDVKGLRRVANIWKKKIDDGIFKSLGDEDAKVVRDALSAGFKDIYTIEGKPMKVDMGVTFSQVSHALSVLKRELRDIDSGLGERGAPNKAMLSKMIKELTTARDGALRSLDENLATKIRGQDKAFAEAKELIDESLINRIITKKKSGGWRISDDKVFQALLSNPSEFKNLVALSRDSKYAELNVEDVLKQGLFSTYRDKVIKERGEDVVANVAKHRNFLATNRVVMESIFTPQEMTTFKTAKGFERKIKIRQQKEKSDITKLNKSIDAKLTRFEPTDVFEAIKGSPQNIKRTLQLFKGDTGKTESIKAMFKRDVLNRISTIDDFGDDVINMQSFHKILRDEGDALTAALGQRYVKEFEELLETVVRKGPKGGGTGHLSGVFAETSPMGVVQAAWRMKARPLSRLGVATTAALKLSGSSARKAFIEIVLNPKIMSEAAYVTTHKVNRKRLEAFFVAVGLGNAYKAAEKQERIREELKEKP